jgi:hypothetical protein
MTQEDIIRMAREADLIDDSYASDWYVYQLRQFAALVAAASAAAAENKACDMGAACIGCSPRNADGSCPDAGPSGTCDCYKDGFRDGMNEFKECYEAQPDAFEQGRQEGMKQERALWTLTKVGQEIEAQPAQEPFGYFKAEPFGWTDCAETDEGALALYEATQQRPWVGLTEEERAIFDAANPKTQEEWDALFNGIEAKLKEKNT